MIRVVGVLVFFFQAEDGMRGAQESRGLGYVYKRQVDDGDPALAGLVLLDLPDHDSLMTSHRVELSLIHI